MKKQYLLIGLLSIAVFAGCKKDLNQRDGGPEIAAEQGGGGSPAEFGANDEFVPNEILVRFKSGSKETGRANAFARISGAVKEHILTSVMKNSGDNEGLYVVRVPTGVSVALQRLQNLVDIEFAEPNYILKHIPLATSTNDADDPYYTSSSENIWGMFGELTTPIPMKYGSRAGEAWSGATSKNADGSINYDVTKQQRGSSNVYVAVIDEGIQYNHKDLLGQVRLEGEIPGDGIDNDGNGKIDDAYGWNFVNNNNIIYAGTEDDHGTHVAGTIGAIGNNNTGVAGVCWNIRIISAKFLGPNGGTTDAAIKAIDYITALKLTGKYNIVASNNSWGGGSKSTALQTAITNHENAGILFIAAAGNSNSNNDKRLTYPSCYPNDGIISVGSIWLDGKKSSFSNYGAKTVDIFAPGSYVWSTTPNDSYAKYSGTSMATPHVTGAAALYASANSLMPIDKAAALKIKTAIMQSARPTTAVRNMCVSKGRLDAHGAWQNKNHTTLAAD